MKSSRLVDDVFPPIIDIKASPGMEDCRGFPGPSMRVRILWGRQHAFAWLRVLPIVAIWVKRR